MSSVGYGDTVASTPVGRFFAILAALGGIYVTGVIVGVQRQFMKLDQSGVEAVATLSKQKKAINAIIAACRY
jgi:hypothetical protein